MMRRCPRALALAATLFPAVAAAQVPILVPRVSFSVTTRLFVPTPGVLVVHDLGREAALVGGAFWIRQDGVWLHATHPLHHWTVVDAPLVPPVLLGLPLAPPLLVPPLLPMLTAPGGLPVMVKLNGLPGRGGFQVKPGHGPALVKLKTGPGRAMLKIKGPGGGPGVQLKGPPPGQIKKRPAFIFGQGGGGKGKGKGRR